MKKVLILITAVLLLAAVISCNGENAFRQEDAVCSVGSRHFASVQSAVDYVTSTTSRAVSEENTIRLLKDILGTNTPEAQRGSIVIPKDYSGSLLIDLSGYSYEFAGSSFISVNGGKDVTVTNGKLIVPSDNSSTGKVLTVSQGELNIKDVIVDDSRPTPLAADVKKNAKLNISATDDKLSSLNGSFTFSLGASMSVNGGTVTFMTIEEPEVKADIRLYKGVIKNSHDVNDRITEAVRNPEIERSIVHTPLAKFNAKATTCTEDGVKEHYVCKTCNGYFLDAECTKPTTASETVILKLGHRDGISEVKAKEPTCTESGNPAYFICTYCQMTFGDGEGKTSAPEKLVIDALGHDLKYVPEKASTCKEQGYGAFYGCTRCERYFSDADAKNEIEELTLKQLNPGNHVKTSYTNISETQHTLKCDDCGTEISTEDHEYGDWKSEEEGKYIRYCVCGTYQTAIGHSLIDVPKKDPTCTEEGMEAHAVCEIHSGEIWDVSHNSILTAEEINDLIINVLGHNYEYKYDSSDHWQECTRCHQKTEKTPHSRNQIVNLGDEGHSIGCSVCKYSSSNPEAHVLSGWTAVEGEQGKALRSCTVDGCDYSISNDGSSIKPVEAKQGSCTEPSNPFYWICTGDGYEFYFNEDKTEVITNPVKQAPGHSYENWETNDNKHWHVCTECGGILDESNHSWLDWNYVSEKTAEKECLICGFKVDNSEWSSSYKAKEEASCSKSGYNPCWISTDGNETIYFSEDGLSILPADKVIIPKTAHLDIELVEGTEPDCTTPGVKEHYICNTCNTLFADKDGIKVVTSDDLILTPRHTWSTTEYHSTSSGHYNKCSVCGFWEDKLQNHKFLDEWVMTEKSFVATNQCRICKFERTTEGVETYTTKEPSDPKCTSAGSTGYRYYPSLNLYFSYDGKSIVDYEATVLQAGDHVFELKADSIDHWYECRYGCGTIENGVKNQHITGDFNSNAYAHWKVCSECRTKTEIAYHKFIPYTDKDGNTYESCSVCGYKKADK